jgi:predicted transcriptional regulator
MAAPDKAPRPEVKVVTVRLDPALHQQVRRIAFDRDESIQGIVSDYLARYVAHHTKEK